jgi:hypothetical protein
MASLAFGGLEVDLGRGGDARCP